jgi:hypothetical protein
MSTFRDALLRELQSRMTDQRPVPRPSRPRRRFALATAGLAAVAVITAVVLSQFSSGTPAYAVTANPDGTVSVRVSHATDQESVNAFLTAKGFHTIAMANTSDLGSTCLAQATKPISQVMRESDTGQGPLTTVDPSKIPAGEVLVLLATPVTGQSGRVVFVGLTFPADSPCLRRIQSFPVITRNAPDSSGTSATSTPTVTPTASANPGCGLAASCPPPVTGPPASADPGCGLATSCPPVPTVPPASRQPNS